MLKGLLKKIVGDTDQREIARLQKEAERINGMESACERLSGEDLGAKTDAFRRRLADSETLDDILVEAFAVVREAAKRTIGLRHYDVQLIGGILLHQGKITEMKTGEGKTLVATLPLYLNALGEKGAHLVTPNDYLSKVGVQWMGPVYHALGLSVGVIQSAAANPALGSFLFDPSYASSDDRFLSLRPVSRREAYQADITYGTNNEFGFDYLRDNMVRDVSECVQRTLDFAIIDEVDNILIDEARTPLIISGPAEESSELYSRFADVVRRLHRSSAESVRLEDPDGDYVLDERTRNVTLTEGGVERVEKMVPELGPAESIYDPEHAHMLPYLDNALRAHVVYRRDKDYIDRDGEIIIVDEFTGRLMHGRRFSEGLHQAIEAKEGVPVRRESLTYATITFQNFFRMYTKLAGMTGTAKTEEEEFRRIYDLNVNVLPTNVEYRATYGDLVTHQRPLSEIDGVAFAGALGEGDRVSVTVYESPDGDGRRFFKRLDLPDLIYPSEKTKFRALVNEIETLHQAGRPLLVGTIAIETSERLSRMLSRKGIPHQVLNAKYHVREAVVIAQAGRSGAVTIATNMAGRGVDIKLGGDPEGVARERLRREGADLAEIPQAGWNHALDLLRQGRDVTEFCSDRWAQVLDEAMTDCVADRERVLGTGGLHILGTERHEARRIDNQLRGRSGRQGDPGSSRFCISLEDELMRRFGGERVQGLMSRFGVGDDMPLQHAWLDRSIEAAQVRVEGYNFDIRKHVLEFDDVVNKQREVIYAQRREVLAAPDLQEQVLRMVREEVGRVTAAHIPGPDPEDWDLPRLYSELRAFFPLPPGFDYRRWNKMSAEDIQASLASVAKRAYEDLSRAVGHQMYRQALQEDATLAQLAQSRDPARRLVHKRVVGRLGGDPRKDVVTESLRRLPSETKAQIEDAFVGGYRLFRDRQLMLRAVDSLWVRHLTDLASLREGIGLRAYGQQNPLVSYRRETHEMYEGLVTGIQQAVARSVYLLPQALAQAPRRGPSKMVRSQVRPRIQTSGDSRAGSAASDKAPGRNDPCWCGSGKKYKRCHMREDGESRRGQMVTGQPSGAPSRRKKR